MPNYLIRRAGRYNYRRRYPVAIAEILGRSEFVQALGTADPAEAARLARRASVEFDIVCDEALAKATQSATAVPNPDIEACIPPSDLEAARAVIDSLPDIIRKITASVISEGGKNPRGWRDEIAWRKRAAVEHLKGAMPIGIQMHPLQARAALNALEALEAGKPMDIQESHPESPPKAIEPVLASTAVTLSTKEFEIAFADYKLGKTSHRTRSAHRTALKILTLPCTQEEARAAMQLWCGAELKRGKTASAVRTELSGVVALLKSHPGWESLTLPKTGEARALKGAGIAKKDGRKPMSVQVVRDVLKRLPEHLPRNGERWHATALLLALYGMRPRELLAASPDALRMRRDVFDKEVLVFNVGENGAKNEASKRALPVPAELEPVFRLALSAGACCTETARTRVDRLSAMVKKAIPEGNANITLYGMRHTFADVARACRYTDAEFGVLLGHTNKAGLTAIYGGEAPLDKLTEILAAVQQKLFPEGLAGYLPTTLETL